MDSFEKQNATDWQPATRAKRIPPRSSGSSPRRPNYNRPSYGQPTQPSFPSLPVQRGAQEDLISFDEPLPRPELSRQAQTLPAQSKWNRSSNIFAALTNADGNSSSSSGSTTPERLPGAQLVSTMPSPNKTSNMDLLIELDGDPFVTSPFNGYSTSREGSKSLLDEDIPVLSREEDDAWFDSQSRCHSRQVAGRPSFRGRGSPLGRGVSRSRGNGHVLNENPQRHNSQVSLTHNFQVSNNYSQRARTYGPRDAHSPSPQASRGHVPRPQTQFRGDNPVSRVSGYMHGSHNLNPATSKPLSKDADNTKIVSAKAAAMQKPPPSQLSDQFIAQKITEAIESEDLSLNLAVQQDTAATSEWRKKGMRPGRIIPLPKRWNLVGPSLDTKSSSKPVLSRVAEISVVTNTHIDTVWGKDNNEETMKLILYGTSQAVEAARRLIIEWLEGIASMHDDKWAKVWAYNVKAEKALRKRLQRDAERQKFRQSISDDSELPKHAVVFLWPLRKEPEKVLGINFEALDPIRMNCLCYITCERDPQTVLKIQGNDEDKVQKALERMRHIPAQWNATAFEVEPFVILDVPYVSNLETLPPVRRVPYHFPRPLHTQATKEGPEDGITFQFKYPAIHELESRQDPESTARKLLQNISKTMQHARYFRGLLKMHIHLGTFVAKRTQSADIDEDTYSYPNFADMMEEHDKMAAKVSSEIGDSIIEQHVLARCFEASHLLAPQDAWVFKLSDVQPIYAATFQITNPAGQAGDFILDVELSGDGGVTNLLSKRWYQLRKGKEDPRTLLDGTIISLKNGLAWHIGLDVFMAVDERGLSPDYQVFPDTLSLDIAAADDAETCHNFINYRPRGDGLLKVPVKTVRERRCWKFNTKKGEWVVEVAQVGKTTIEQQAQTVFEPRWTFNLYNNNWDQLLASNNRTEIGQAADWGHGNPCNILIPENPDTSILTGTARQDREESDESDQDESDAEELEEHIVKPEEEVPSLHNSEQLLDLLRQLADMVVGKPGRVL